MILHPEKHLDVYAYVVTEYTVCIDKTVTCKVKAAFKQCLLVFSAKILHIYMFLLTSFNVKNTIFRDVAPCSMVEVYEHSGGTPCTHYQGRCT